MRNPLSRTVGCLVTVVLLAISALPLAVAQEQERREHPAAALAGEDLIKLTQELQKEVEELRGWKFKHPVRTDVRSEQQLREFIEKKALEEEYGKDGLPVVEAFLRMVGLIPADCDLRKTIMDVLLNQVGGFYDHESKAFFMLKRVGVDYGPLVNRIMIAHELTHALDDQYVDLGRLIESRERTEDGSLAIGALVEGSATVLMMRYATKAMQSGQYDATQLIQVIKQEEQRSRVFMEAPPYFSSIVSMYVCGMCFLLGEEGFGGMVALGEMRNVGDKVLQAAKDPPVSTEQILHPRKYWSKTNRDYPVEVNDADVERLLKRPGLQVVHKDTVGELLCALLTTDENRVLDIIMASLPTYWTNEAATGWGGDRFFLLAEGKDVTSAKKNLQGLKGVWVTLWDTPDDRDEFLEDYQLERELPARSAFKLSDRGAVFLFGFDPVRREALQRRFTRQPPAFTKNGKLWKPSKD